MKLKNNINKVLPAFLGLALATGAQAACGIFGGNINVNSSGAGDAWMSLNDFNGHDYGQFNPDSGDTLILVGAEGLTWQNGGSDFGSVTLNYSIQPRPDGPTVPHGSFMGADLASASAGSSVTDSLNDTYDAGEGSTNELWSLSWDTPNVLAGLEKGKYELQVFLSGTTTPDGDQYLNNGGPNYTAYFEVVPEPSSAALLGLGGIALILRRRK